MAEWIIDRLEIDRDLDDLVALEALCFTNPTTREMFLAEAQKSDVAHGYVLRRGAPADDATAASAAGHPTAASPPDASDTHGRDTHAGHAHATHAPLLAYCSVWLIFDELHINTLAVHPDWRRQGLASYLLAHVLADAARQGALKATLEVRRSNEAARKLYERFGFTLGGVRPAYYRQPVEDALILWRDPLAWTDPSA